MELNQLKATKGSRDHKVKKYGRGFGSGIGKTAGRGTKGQGSRKSGNVRIGFEGGQTPIYRKTPKIGFNNVNFATKINVVTLQNVLNLKKATVTKQDLLDAKLICCTKMPVKLIDSNIELTSALTVHVSKASKGVIEKIQKANGAVVIE